MRMNRRLLTILGILFFQTFSQLAYTWNEGARISIPVVSKDPNGLHGFNLALWYDPETLTWRQFHLYFDVLGAHYWVNGPSYHYHDINLVAVSPIIRYLFNQHFFFKPYIELSIGLTYLSNTRFANQNLGMRFSFQDRGGIGLFMGKNDQFALGAHIVHYSNASLSSHNSGITIPLLIDLSYKLM